MALEVDKYLFKDEGSKQLLYDPIKLQGFVPEKDSEVYVSRIPYSATIYEVLHFFEQVGKVFQVRLMMQPNLFACQNRGYGFVTFHDKTFAQNAINDLKKVSFQQYYLKIEKSMDNCRIFLRGIPVQKTKEEISSALQNIPLGETIANVIVHRNYRNANFNRGYIFLEFSTHEEASRYRARFHTGFNLFGKKIEVDWSVPIEVPDETELPKIKILFVRNLDLLVERCKIGKFIKTFIEPCFIDKIYENRNYAYIHLTTHEHAEMLLNKLKVFFEGTSVEVCFSTPPNKFSNKDFRQAIVAERRFKSRAFANRSATASTSINTPLASTPTPSTTSSIFETPSSPSQTHLDINYQTRMILYEAYEKFLRANLEHMIASMIDNVLTDS